MRGVVIKFITKYWALLLVGLSVLFLIANIVFIAPGYMSYDSLVQLSQALGVSSYADWHPPIMAFLWSIGIAVTGKVSSMLVFQLVILWSSLLLLSLYVYKKINSKALSLLPIVLGLMPFVINISGVIWKDVHMAFALLLAVSLGLMLGHVGKKTKVIFLITITLSLVYAITLRYNAALAVIPVVYFIASLITSRRSLQVASIAGVIVLALVVSALLSIGLHVQKTNPTSAVMLDDILNFISPKELQQAGVSSVLRNDILSIQAKCRAQKIIIHSNYYCTSGDQRNHIQYKYYDNLRSLWADTLVTNTLSYIRYRLTTFWLFLVTPRGYEYIQHSTIDVNGLGQTVHHKQLSKIVSDYVDFFAKDFGVLFRPYFWVIVSIGTLVYSHKRLVSHKRIVSCLTVSSILYIVGYFPVVIGADYRYIYWPVLAMSVAFVLIFTEKRMRVGK